MGESEAAGHHIRAVVDYFLSTETAAAGPRAGGPDRANYRFGVTAPVRGWLAAFACAHLARASLPPPGGRRPVRVRLEERHSQAWTAEHFLGGTGAEHLRSLFGAGRRTDPGAGRSLTGVAVGGELIAVGTAPCAAGEDRGVDGADRGADGAEPRVGGEVPGAGAVVTWVHLGRVTSAAGQRPDERGVRWPLAPPPRGLDGLVWCVTVAEVTGMRAAYELGAALAELSPAQLKLLLFPMAWSGPGAAGKGRSGTGRAPGAAAETDLARCALLARDVAGAVPLEVVPVEGGPEWLEAEGGDAAGGRDRLFRRLVESLEQGAAALRRASVSTDRAVEARA